MRPQKYITSIFSVLTIIICLLIIINAGCGSKTENQQILTDKQRLKALSALNSSCFSCHNPDANVALKTAPHFEEVRKKYSSAENFIQAMIAFLNAPSEAISLMPEAVKQYGLMPKITMTKDDVAIIAQYIYETDMASPEWLSEWKNLRDSLLSMQKNESYEARGLRLAMAAKSVLGKNLMQALKQGGSEFAIEFCNTRAIVLTDSMSGELNANIKRVSDKPRNPANAANEEEIRFIQLLKEKLAAGESLTPSIRENPKSVTGWYVIETGAMCLQCHGVPEKDINDVTLKKINQYYPDDKATGYAENQVRGIWVVEMEKR